MSSSTQLFDEYHTIKCHGEVFFYKWNLVVTPKKLVTGQLEKQINPNKKMQITISLCTIMTELWAFKIHEKMLIITVCDTGGANNCVVQILSIKFYVTQFPKSMDSLDLRFN